MKVLRKILENSSDSVLIEIIEAYDEYGDVCELAVTKDYKIQCCEHSLCGQCLRYNGKNRLCTPIREVLEWEWGR